MVLLALDPNFNGHLLLCTLLAVSAVVVFVSIHTGACRDSRDCYAHQTCCVRSLQLLFIDWHSIRWPNTRGRFGERLRIGIRSIMRGKVIATWSSSGAMRNTVS